MEDYSPAGPRIGTSRLPALIRPPCPSNILLSCLNPAFISLSGVRCGFSQQESIRRYHRCSQEEKKKKQPKNTSANVEYFHCSKVGETWIQSVKMFQSAEPYCAVRVVYWWYDAVVAARAELYARHMSWKLWVDLVWEQTGLEKKEIVWMMKLLLKVCLKKKKKRVLNCCIRFVSLHKFCEEELTLCVVIWSVID